jgi:hypothetical protein
MVGREEDDELFSMQGQDALEAKRSQRRDGGYHGTIYNDGRQWLSWRLVVPSLSGDQD